MKVLVTGGAGFIGSHLVDRLLKTGNEVVCLDNLSEGSLKNLEEADSYENFRFIQGDVRSEKDLEESIRNVDAVFHEAAITSVPFSVENPDLTRDVNVNGTVNVLEKSIEEGVDKFVFASSCAVYGKPNSIPISEDSSLNVLSPYAESKLSGEDKCKECAKKNDLETVILRYFNVYGPRQSGGSYAGVIVKFLERLKKGRPPIIYGDGEQTRDFVNVRDVVRANLVALKKDGVNSEEFNVGSGIAISINDLCEKILQITGNSELKPVYIDSREGEVRHSKADLSKSSQVLGYEPEISLEEGLNELINNQ